VIAYWARLPDGTLGIRVRGKPIIGSCVVVRYADAREPAREFVGEIVGERDGEVLCRIARATS
jgi:hypothetical protein